MPVLDYMIPCQLSSVDVRTAGLSLFNVVETFEVVQRPHESEDDAWNRAVVPIEIVTLWRQAPGESPEQRYVQVIKLAGPDDTLTRPEIYLAEPEDALAGPEDTEIELSTMEFSIPHFRHRVHVQLAPLPIREAGDYLLRLYLWPADQFARATDPITEYPIRVSKTSIPIVVDLTDQELEWIQRPVKGQGGFQSLMRRIQGQLNGNRLIMPRAEGERLVRYAGDYKQGGFQDRIKTIADRIQEQLVGS